MNKLSILKKLEIWQIFKNVETTISLTKNSLKKIQVLPTLQVQYGSAFLIHVDIWQLRRYIIEEKALLRRQKSFNVGFE